MGGGIKTKGERKMKNTLTDLNDFLFEAIESLQNYEMTEEELEKEIKRSEAVTKVAGTIINNASLQLQAIKHADEYGGRKTLPSLLTGEKND